MSIFYSIRAYLTFLWKSGNEHAVHSPFVFRLVTQCFYDQSPKPEYDVLHLQRKSLLKDDREIEVTDFGAGSRVFRSNRRAISRIAKTAGISNQRAQLLFRLVQYLKPNHMLELGTSLGLATAALSKGNPDGKITTVEGCPETARVAQSLWKPFQMQNINLYIGSFEEFLASIKTENTPQVDNDVNETNQKYQLIYFDGNHSREATLRYFEDLLPTITNETVWIFDDIHWSEDMSKAWEIMKMHPKVRLTIDTFQWGLVFFRREQEKEHFVIRC